MQNDYDVVIIGGGVLGCASAYRVAADRDVLVLEREQLAASASGAGAGVVSPTLFLGQEPAVARLCNDFFREFDGEHGFSLTEHPRLELIQEPEAVSDAKEWAGRLSDAGFPVSYLDSGGVEARYPTMATAEVAGAIEFRDTAWVDTATLTTALAEAAQERGATIRTGVAVTDVLRSNGQATGVETTEGQIQADTVVAAAGWANPTFLPEDVSVPVEPYRTQCAIVDLDSDAMDYPIWRRPDAEIYARPWDDDQFLVGGGSGPLTDTGSERLDPSFRESVSDLVPRVYREEESARIASGWTGIAGMTADGWPIVAEPDAVAGLVVVQGAVMGIMGAPAISKAVETVITGADCPFDPATFALDRFEEADADFEVHSVSSGHYNH